MKRNYEKSKNSKLNPESNDEKIHINGYRQIVEMLNVADDAFRDSLLRRLNRVDSRLTASLKRDFLIESKK